MKLPIYEPALNSFERVVVRAADGIWGDYFSDYRLCDQLPCLKPYGPQLMGQAMKSLIKKGLVRLVFAPDPTDRRSRGTCCLSSRVSQAQVEKMWTQAGYRPTPYQLYCAHHGL
jgi:hypothetical protein